MRYKSGYKSKTFDELNSMGITTDYLIHTHSKKGYKYIVLHDNETNGSIKVMISPNVLQSGQTHISPIGCHIIGRSGKFFIGLKYQTS
jgi:hypothetical protein